MIRIDPASETSRALAAEFKRAPNGPHGADLQKLLQLLRWGYARGRTVIVCTQPYTEWRLGCMAPARGLPVEVSEDQAFSSHDDAVWACFRARWQEVFGQPCPVE
jgi:hypothetical protein